MNNNTDTRENNAVELSDESLRAASGGQDASGGDPIEVGCWYRDNGKHIGSGGGASFETFYYCKESLGDGLFRFIVFKHTADYEPEGMRYERWKRTGESDLHGSGFVKTYVSPEVLNIQ